MKDYTILILMKRLKKLIALLIINILLFSCTHKNIKRKIVNQYKGRIYFKDSNRSLKAYYTLRYNDEVFNLYIYSKFGNDVGKVILKNGRLKLYDQSGTKLKADRYKKIIKQVYQKLKNENFKNEKVDNIIMNFSDKTVGSNIPKIWVFNYYSSELKLVFYND